MKTTKDQPLVAFVYVETGKKDPVSYLEEFNYLLFSNGMSVCFCARFSVKHPSPSTFLNSGQVESLGKLCRSLKVQSIVLNIPVQARIQRNLEKILCTNIVDRTEMLLQLFEKRADTAIGKIQVEMARLQYMSTKLVRGWTHLERQRGGIGLRSGPGETQIEVDRRILRDKIGRLKKKLLSLEKTQNLNRKRRVHSNNPVVALIGYTNAGKSTLFNRLTGADTHVMDQLFATLDPLARKAQLLDGREFIVIDTIGFIRDLPSTLVSAFRTTLTEIHYADILLHVIDCSDPNWQIKEDIVLDTVRSLECESIPMLKIFNKSDKLSIDNTDSGLYLSARTGEGIDKLYSKLYDHLTFK
ncbi:MAG: GTPase HflX [Pseudomonadota bacterium]|nr:GTPase HflX [Pseudomonadota bacterium]